MMIDWPQALVREIATGRSIFFLGAGVSASAKDTNGNHPKTWSEFLNEATALIREAEIREAVSALIAEKNYLIALQGIRDSVDAGDFRNLLNQCFNNHAFLPSDLHEAIYELNLKIVVTTNFDNIYERYCLRAGEAEAAGAFKVITNRSVDFCDELRSDTRLIVKAHGSINEIAQMVFTRSEYHRAKRDCPGFYELLKALFLTNTVVFVGCGMQDPDVLLLLEDVRIAGSAERPHYVVVREGEQTPPVVADWRDTYNVKALCYGPNYDDLIPNIENLTDLVLQERQETGLA